MFSTNSLPFPVNSPPLPGQPRGVARTPTRAMISEISESFDILEIPQISEIC